ncbi:hypothetical protein PENTCL1PPCAC_27427, partial [Pristionchus entomophagus]
MLRRQQSKSRKTSDVKSDDKEIPKKEEKRTVRKRKSRKSLSTYPEAGIIRFQKILTEIFPNIPELLESEKRKEKERRAQRSVRDKSRVKPNMKGSQLRSCSLLLKKKKMMNTK